MSITNGPNLPIMVDGAQGDGHYNEFMAFLRAVNFLTQCSIKDKDLTAPPGSPADGDGYIIAASPTGAWSGQAKSLTRWSSVAAAWEFYAPKAGWITWVADEAIFYHYTGSAWATGPT